MGTWAPGGTDQPRPAGQIGTVAHSAMRYHPPRRPKQMAGAAGRGMEDPKRLRWSSDTLRVIRVLAEEVIGERGSAGRRRPLRAARRRRRAAPSGAPK